VTHSQYRGTRFFPALDGLRCLSIVAVIWHHAGGVHHSGVLSHGYHGVSLFFTISGFLITTLLLRERAETGAISLRDFYIRRTLRIFPLYYAVLALYAVVVVRFERNTPAGMEFFHNLPAFLTYTSNLFVAQSGTRVIFYFAWSLATEEQFYLVWPWIVRLARAWYVPALVMGGLVVMRQGLELAGVQAVSLPMRIALSVATPICLGCLAAYALDRPGSFRIVQALLGRPWSGLAGAASVVLTLAVGAPDFFVYLAMAWWVASSAVAQRSWIGPVLTNPAIRYVGTISYGMYLLHMLAMNVVRRALSGEVAVFLGAVALSAAAASVSYRFFEHPFLSLKARFSPKGVAAQPAATAPLTIYTEPGS
jgi:peptidoglycan/LPS O-acetylase OafA/YrhL